MLRDTVQPGMRAGGGSEHSAGVQGVLCDQQVADWDGSLLRPESLALLDARLDLTQHGPATVCD